IFRFLATGDSFQTIAFSFRLGHSTVHNIVKDVCVAIIDKLLVE
ncbi:protein ALP1-like, partial [Aphis craccivora]